MPIWLRKFTFQSIQSFYKKEQEEINKMQNQSNSKGTTSINMSETNKINIPDFIKITLLIPLPFQKILNPNIYNKIICV